MKGTMIMNASKTGGFIALYIFFTSSLEATLGSVLGAGAGLLYLKGLQQYVDSFTGETEVLPWHA